MMRVYSVRDVKDNSFNRQLTLAGTDASATRAFSEAINNPQAGTYYTHPADFELYYVADFNDETGLVIPNESAGPVFVVRGDSLVNKQD